MGKDFEDCEESTVVGKRRGGGTAEVGSRN
jgi:hypothetical protein